MSVRPRNDNRDSNEAEVAGSGSPIGFFFQGAMLYIPVFLALLTAAQMWVQFMLDGNLLEHGTDLVLPAAVLVLVPGFVIGSVIRLLNVSTYVDGIEQTAVGFAVVLYLVLLWNLFRVIAFIDHGAPLTAVLLTAGISIAIVVANAVLHALASTLYAGSLLSRDGR